MKINYILISALACLAFIACEEEESLKAPTDVQPTYSIPQGKSAADPSIVELYNKYGTYFLYEFTQTDLNWDMINNPQGTSTYHSKEGDPMYVAAALDLIKETWLNLYPEAFLKKNLPFKVFMCSELEQEWVGSIYAKYGWDNIAVSCTDISVTTMNTAGKKAYKNNVNLQFISYLIGKAVIVCPETFYSGTDYSSSISNTESASNYYLKRGLVEMDSGFSWNGTDKNKANDVKAYLNRLLSYSETENSALADQYPLIKTKYNVIRNYFINTFGFDLQKVGNKTFE